VGTGPLRAVNAFEAPRAIRVITAPDGTPHAVIACGRRRLVLAVREDWLIQDRWWTDAPVDRHYHELLVEPGTIVTVYRDTRDGEGFSHTPL
jgi:hypothetical protein